MNITNAAFLLMLLCGINAWADIPRDKLESIYRNAAEKMAAHSPLFGAIDSASEIEGPESIGDFGKYYRCSGKVYIEVRAMDGALGSALNRVLFDAILDGKYGQALPEINPADAIKRARDYLEKFNFNIPDTCVLREVAFYDNLWHVSWEPTWEGHKQLNFDTLKRLRQISVIFHEEAGLFKVQSELSLPVPDSLKVSIPQEAAIEKSDKLVDDVMRTPYYRMARMSGFKANGIKSCELRILKPNWLFDPKRVIWGLIRADEPATETRLCWVVTYTTIDTLSDTRGRADDGTPIQLSRPDILIFIDASTGECVGANFT